MIQHYRDGIGMSQDKLGEAIGVSSVSISNMETGKYMPSLEHMLRIRDVLSIPWEAFEGLTDGSKNLEMRHYCHMVENNLNKRSQDIVVQIMKTVVEGFQEKENNEDDEGKG